MLESTIEPVVRQRPVRGTALVILAALAMALAVYAQAPSVQAQEPKPDSVPPPPGDCWNGALNGDPIHCHFLEEAQTAGKIDISAVYEAPGGGPLYIFLEQTGHVSDETGAFFKTEAYEYLESEEGEKLCPSYVQSGPSGFVDSAEPCKTRFRSILDRTWWGMFEIQHVEHNAIPHSRVYEKIYIYPGGAEARSSSVGWASWRQVWPTAETKFAHESASSTTFDVSDVDLTNIPDPDCEEEFEYRVNISSCLLWSSAAETGAAGRYTHSSSDTIYVQLTSPIPDDEAELEALKQLVAPGYEKYSPPPHIGSRYKVELIPVEYDFGQLWKWSQILDRFALSAGNTVGITGGHIGPNIKAYGTALVWMNGVEPAGEDHSKSRQILIVSAYDPHLAAPALPGLLPQLGIPADVLGLVVHDDHSPYWLSVPLGTDTLVDTVSETAGSSNTAGTGNDAGSTDAPASSANTDGKTDLEDPKAASSVVSVADNAGSDVVDNTRNASGAGTDSESNDALAPGAESGGDADQENSKTAGRVVSETDNAGLDETESRRIASGAGTDSESNDTPAPGTESDGDADQENSKKAGKVVSETDNAGPDETENTGNLSGAGSDSVSGDVPPPAATSVERGDSGAVGVKAVTSVDSVTGRKSRSPGVGGADRSGVVAASGQTAEPLGLTIGIQTWIVAVSAAVIALAILATATFSVRRRRRCA